MNEAAFLFVVKVGNLGRDELQRQGSRILQDAWESAVGYVGLGAGGDPAPSPVERREVLTLGARLRSFFAGSQFSGPTTWFPEFCGNGILSQCRGDVLVDDYIYEVKAGDRKFRAIDYRQLSLYAALHFAKTRKVFSGIGVVNPRTGVTVSVEMDDFCYEASGRTSIDFFETIIGSLSADLVSN